MTPTVSPQRRKTLRPAKPKQRRLPPYRVILHNDDVNDMGYVVLTIRKLTGVNQPEAIERMREAHATGCALLVVTHRERAELYVEQFASCGMTVTAEPAT